MSTDSMDDLQTSPAETPRHLRRFLMVLGCCSVLLYLLPFALVRVPGYARFSPNTTVDSMDYVFRTPHIDADVVILGDSAAMNGPEPELMSQELHGARVINLANMITTLPVMGNVELRRYLQQNRRPKVLVLYGTAWEADYLKQKEGQLRYSGEEMLFRHGTPSEIYHYVVKNPGTVSIFPLSFYSLSATGLHWGGSIAPKANTLGHVVIRAKNLQDDCAIPEPFLAQSSGIDTTQRMLSEFHGAADHVIYYAAPMPICRSTRGSLLTPYAELGARPPLAYPARLFLDDKYYAHLVPGEGTAAASRDLSNVLAPLLGETEQTR